MLCRKEKRMLAQPYYNIKGAWNFKRIRSKGYRQTSSTIPPQLKSELIKHRFKRQNEQYVFVRVKNHNLPMDENAFYHAWHNFKREMDISNGAKVYRNQIIESTLSEDLEPYLLRHTFCTDCQAAGVPINVAKELMGHSDISVTAKIYTHMVDEVFEQNRKRLQEYAQHKQNQTVTT